MGINALLPFVDKAAGSDVHLSDFAGKIAAIDGYYWLHRGARLCPIEMVRGTYATGFVDYCIRQVELLRRHGVEPLVVLDGARLPAKSGTEERRHDKRKHAAAEAAELLRRGMREQATAAYLKAVNITAEHAYQFILALRKRQVRYIVAPYEADAQIAKLATSGEVHLVLAEDSDMLAFGCPRVLTKLDYGSGYGRLLERSKLQAAKDGGQAMFQPWNEWDQGGRFLELCILAGCDYLDAIKGVAIKSAHKLLKQHKSAEKVAKFLGMEGKFPDGPAGLAEYLEQLQQAKETFRHQRVYDPKLKKVVPLTPPPPNAPIMPHCGADIADDLAYKLCELGALHPETWQQLVVPGAPPERPQQQQPQPQPLPPPPPPVQQQPSAASSSSTASTVTSAFQPSRPAGGSSSQMAALLPWGGGGGSSARRHSAPPLKQSSLGNFARASSFTAAQAPQQPHAWPQPPPPPMRSTVPTEEAPAPVELYSKRAAKAPFKVPRPIGANAPAPPPPPASSSSSQPRHVSGLKRSRFFGSSTGEAAAEAKAADEAEDEDEDEEDEEQQQKRRRQERMEKAHAETEAQLSSYAFTPSSATTRPRRASSAGGEGVYSGGASSSRAKRSSSSSGGRKRENRPLNGMTPRVGTRSSPRLGLQRREEEQMMGEFDIGSFAFARESIG